jgi:hypothetical protein
MFHMAMRLLGSNPVVGSSRKSTGGEVEPATHAARVRLGQPRGGVDQVEALQQLLCPPAGHLLRQVVEPPDHLQVLAAREVLVNGGVLARESDVRA